MKIAWILLSLPVAAFAAGPPAAERMLDPQLTVAQRNNACFELRGKRDAETLRAMAQALRLQPVRACAVKNLQIAGAVDELRAALNDETPEVRAAAARELGAFQKPELLPALAQAAAEPNLLVALNGMYALAAYRDKIVWPYLEPLARKGGMIGVMALDRIFDLGDPQALEIARKLLAGGDLADQAEAMRVIGLAGDESDLPALRAIAAKPGQIMVRQRGFGLLSNIDISKAAKATIEQIEARRKQS